MALRGGGDWHMAYLLVYRKLETVERGGQDEETKMDVG